MLSLLAVFCGLLAAGSAGAQTCPGKLIPDGGAPGLGHIVAGTNKAYATLQMPNGEIIVGGDFQAAGTVTASGIVRWSPTNQQFFALGAATGFCCGGWNVRALALLPDGDVLVGGRFNAIGGVNSKNLARWSPASGQWSAVGDIRLNSFDDATIYDIKVMPDGDVIIGGQFTYASVTARNLVRWRPSTNTWTSFTNSAPGIVRTMAFLSDGDLVAAGAAIPSDPNTAICRFNLTTGAASNMSIVTVSTTIRSVLTLPGGDLAAVGAFTMIGGVDVVNTARWNASTGMWAPMGSNASSPQSLRLSPANEILMCGTVSGLSCVSRWNAGSSSWVPITTGVTGQVFTLEVLPGNKYLIGGDQTYVGSGTQAPAPGLAATRVALWDGNTATWAALVPGTDASVWSLIALSGGDYVVGGDFTVIGGVRATRAAKWSAALGSYVPMGTGTNTPITGLSALPNGDVMAIGSFSFAGGTPVVRIARWDEAADVWVDPGRSLSDYYYSLGKFADGDLAVMTTAGLQRYDAASNTWTVLNGTSVPTIQTALTLPNGDVLIGGSFTNIGGVNARGVARWRASTGLWEALGTPIMSTGGTVRSMVRLSNGDIVVGGAFTVIGGIQANAIARWTPGTDTWSPIGAGAGNVWAMTLLPDGSLLAGGLFLSAGGQAAGNLARVDLSSNTWRSILPGTQGEIRALALLPNGDVKVGGDFYMAGGKAAGYIATFRPICPCNAADVAGLGGSPSYDSVLTADDLVYYLSQFFAGNIAVADLVGLGGSPTLDGVLTADDLVYFLAQFFAPCTP